MMNGETLAVIFGLASAASWGAGDFSGGVATKQWHVFRVIFLSQILGAILLTFLAWLFREPVPEPGVLLVGSLAGIVGMIGLVALYLGLAGRRMGLIAPLTAVVAAIVSVLAAILIEGLPSAKQLAGFAGAVAAVRLLSGPQRGVHVEPGHLILPAVSGLSFGLFFILIDQVSDVAVLWPLVSARVASVPLLGLLILVRRAGDNQDGLKPYALIALAGAFDAGGNAFFALASRNGRLDIAAVLSSLYPAATVLLAWLLLRERLGRMQWVGVGLALIAMALIAA